MIPFICLLVCFVSANHTARTKIVSIESYVRWALTNHRIVARNKKRIHEKHGLLLAFGIKSYNASFSAFPITDGVSLHYNTMKFMTYFIAFTIAEACSSTVAFDEQDMKFIKYSWASSFFGIPACVIQYIQCLFHCFDTLPETSSCHRRSWTQYTGKPFDFARQGLGICSWSAMSSPTARSKLWAKKSHQTEVRPMSFTGLRLRFLSSG